MTALLELGLSELLGALDRGEVTSRAATEACLAAVERTRDLNAYLSVDARGALAAADAADRARKAGDKRALLGVPLALKDIFLVEGSPTTCASRILENHVAAYDGTPAKRLKDAGAVLLGKLNMDEFAMGSSNENSAFGPARNPWNKAYAPGGSSGGSAIAVAARTCYGTLGTDTGGSIRQPAAQCGVTGIKPTYGRVSRYGVIAFASSLDQVGPLARSVEDNAHVLRAIAGHDPHDQTSSTRPVPDYVAACKRPVKGMRLGFAKEYFIAGIDPEVRASVEAAIAVYRSLGVEVVETSLPHTEYAVATYYLVATAEASSNLARYDGVRYGLREGGDGDLLAMYMRTRSKGFGPEVKRRIMLGTYALSAGYYDAYYLRAQKVRTLITRDFEQAFAQGIDALIVPTSPTPPFKLGEKLDDPLKMYLADIFTISCNLAGLPGLALPCGFTRDALPLGMQLLGAHWQEEKLFALGHAYQLATDWHRRSPPG